jgi:hypothetical protein
MKYFVAGFAAMVMLLSTGASPAAIGRIDLFDKADNLLLFVTFEYDSAGNNNGRTVYTGDSTFLRSTRLTRDAGGTVTSENNYDYEGNLFSVTKLTQQSGKTDVTMKDQFDMDLLGAPVSVTKGTAGAYAISQSGGAQYTQKYLFDGDGNLTRIDYADAAGTPLYHANVIQRTATVHPRLQRGGSGVLSPHFRMNAGKKPVVTFTLAEQAEVTVELFTPAGRLVMKVVSGALLPGRHSLDLLPGALAGSGTFIARMSVNGAAVFCDHLIVTR